MKSLISFFLAALFTLFSGYSYAQNMIRQAPCSDELINHQADSIKKELSDQGFMVLKEASITMESEYEMPVIVPLTEGSWYSFVFIGDASSKLYELRMFDWSEKQVVYEKQKSGDLNASIISFNYIPRISEYHMIKPVQVNKKKKKGLCGYVIMLKKVKGEVKDEIKITKN
jgi:hypothetical protein